MFGRLCFTLTALGQILGPFIADFNETHVKNPRWPPHAKFHNGQTMSMGLSLGLATLYYTYRQVPQALKPDNLFIAAILGSLYWITGMSAILYPGSLGIDPEFGEGFPQGWAFSVLAAIPWLGYWVEIKKLGSGEKKLA